MVDPTPDPVVLKDTYEWNRYHEVEYLGSRRDEARRHIRALELLRDHIPDAQSILDFGCGSGRFLGVVQQQVAHCEGVEYTESAIRESARRSGAPVSSLSAVRARGVQFDVVHLSDVLPHLPDPLGTLRELETLLAPGGRFLVDGPLEQNASLVLWTSKGIKALRRRFDRDGVAVRPPTMLVRLDRDAQRSFFRDQLGYREDYFAVYETGWPLRGGGSSLLRAFLGWAAVLVSWLDPSRPRHIGNRFLAVLRPTDG